VRRIPRIAGELSPNGEQAPSDREAKVRSPNSRRRAGLADESLLAQCSVQLLADQLQLDLG
jgi:hypothetical protein